MTIDTLVISTQTSSTASWTPTAIRTSQIDAQNPTYPRTFRLDNQFVTLSIPGYVCGISLESLVDAFIAIVPQLTWPPKITAQPTNQIAAPTGSASFAVTVNSELSVTYQWKVSTNGGSTWSNVSNGGVYSGATTATLSISNAAGLNGHQYQCVCTNGSGATTTYAAGLTLDPLITAQPVNQSVAHGSGASTVFSVVATGNSALTYQWQVSTNSGSTWSNITTAGTLPVYANWTTSILTVGSLTTTGPNGYQYRCNVTDTNGTATSTAATLTVT